MRCPSIPNICFNEKFEAVLINFDRAKRHNSFFQIDWHDFGCILDSLRGSRGWTAAWDDFVAHSQKGNKPNFKVLEDQENVQDQVKVENVLHERR